MQLIEKFIIYFYFENAVGEHKNRLSSENQLMGLAYINKFVHHFYLQYIVLAILNKTTNVLFQDMQYCSLFVGY